MSEKTVAVKLGRPKGTTNLELGKPAPLTHKQRQERWKEKKRQALAYVNKVTN